MDKKTLGSVEIKSESKGEIRAVFSTLNVVDKDGDITVKGAMQDGAQVRISAYNHKSWDGALPVGIGTIREIGDEVVLEGQFFMNTTHGRDTFETVKALGALQEFSYGFDVVDSSTEEAKSLGAKRVLKSLKVHEVSPVLLGAGMNTRVLEAKSEKKSLADELAEVVASVKSVRERCAEVMAMRTGKGKASPLGEDSGALIKAVEEEFSQLGALLESAEPSVKSEETDESANEELRAAYLRFMSSDL
ncbi:HK97 family phage prohead protease [Streptomyces sp. NPDC002855]|uniref:HK97 family phage prohead protease n=1 Tax=Streptomyces sp. NPDC002855 TaxID=3154437 RepID=UPI0033323777